MPYAANGIVSQSPLEGGIEITDAQYREAIQGMLSGLVVSIKGGFHMEAPAPEAPAPVPEPEPEPETPEQVQKAYENAIQLHMDNTARTFGYDNIMTVVSYAEEPAVPKFQHEGRAFRAWRSLVWAYAYEQLELVKSGEREQQTIADFILELPELVIPEPEPIQEPVAEEPAPTDTTNEGTPV